MEDLKIIELYWNRDEEAIREMQNKYGNYCYSIAYNILYNNCEHFAYECIFGKKYSSQTDKAKEIIKQMATGQINGEV